MEYIKILGILLVLSAIATIPTQFSIVQTLKKNGYNASMFMFLPSDFREYKKLMREEYDLPNKAFMKIIYFGYIIPLIVGSLSIISIILILVFK